MNEIRKSASLILLCCLILLTGACDKTYQREQNGSRQNVKPLPHPKYVEPFVKCIEYYYQMYGIRDIKKSGEFLPYEYREFYNNLICPILDESRKTNIYELNSLYPELGTHFYAELITSLKIIQNVREKTKSDTEILEEQGDRGLIGNLLIVFSKEKFDEDSNKLIKRAELLLNSWENWLDTSADKIGTIIKDNYDLSNLKKALFSAKRFNLLGICCFNKDECDRAISFFTQSLNIESNNADVYQYRGSAYFKKKDYDSAIKDYTNAISLDAKNIDSYIKRGLVYSILKEYDLALNDYKSALAIDSNSFEVFYLRGIYYIEMKEYDLAIEDFTISLKSNPGYADAFWWRGDAYFHLKNYSKAKQDWENAAAYGEKDLVSSAYYNLACAYSIENELNISLGYIKKCLELKSHSISDIENDPDLSNLRKDPRYQELLKNYKNQAIGTN